MRVSEIKKKARTLGVKPGKMNKTDLIRAIQKEEGNSECYDSNISQCGEMECCWRNDCMTV